jgi:hypothetical protein
VNPFEMNVRQVEPFSANFGLENNSQEPELFVLQRAAGDIASSSQNELWSAVSPFLKTTVEPQTQEPQELPSVDLWSDWVALLKGHIQDVQGSVQHLRQDSLMIGSWNLAGKRTIARRIQSSVNHLTEQQAALLAAEKNLEALKSNEFSQ